jgi:hypothetical protein
MVASLRSVAPLAAAVLLAGCPGQVVEHPQDGITDPEPEQVPLELTVTSPAYGEFARADTIAVVGVVAPPTAEVRVEEERVEVAEDGSFVVEVALDHAYRNLDVVATSGDEEQRWRTPVFAGSPPAETWTGGATARLLPEGLQRLGPVIGGVIDGAGWAEGLEASLPSVQTDYLSLIPDGLVHDATEVELTAADGGIDVVATLNGLSLNYELLVTLGGSWSFPVVFGFDEVVLSALATPTLDDDGVIWLELSGAAVDLGEADLEFGVLEGWIAEWLFDVANDYVTEPLADLLLEYVLGSYGTLELGGPFSTEFDLLGTGLAIDLADLWADLDGPAATLAMDLDGAVAADPLLMAAPVDGDVSDADLALGVHEALLDTMITDTAMDLLEQELQLGGTFGAIIGTAMEAIPGGGDIPDNDGWCVSLEPGTAHVVRLQSGVEPLAVLYLPDLRFDVEVMIDGSCEEWLEASLAVEAGLAVEDGTALDFDVQVPEGIVLEYETTDDWDEAEVLDGVAGLIEALIGLAGGFVDLDLADLLGGLGEGLLPEGSMELAVVDSQPMLDETSEPIEGLYAIAIRLFSD